MREKVWFHGGAPISDWSQVRWDRDRSESDLNAEGPGMYWTTDAEEASSYRHGSEGVVYRGVMRASFRKMPTKKPPLRLLLDLYGLASPDDQEVFLSNWQVEWPAKRPEVLRVLTKYTHQTTLFDACVTLYHDLFRYDSDAYVSAMRAMDYDGYVVKKGTTGGSRKRDHLVLWNPKAMEISDA